MHQSISNHFNIISSTRLTPKIVQSLVASHCSLILPLPKNSALKEYNALNTEAITNRQQHKIIFAPAITHSNQSIYSLSKALYDFCEAWKSENSRLLLILDSTFTSILTYRFSPPCSYILVFKRGSNDYSFEYIEYIINKLSKHNYSIVSAATIRNAADIHLKLNANKNICLFAYYSEQKNSSIDKGMQKKIGKFLMAELGKKELE